jgi:hypothetical protein
MDNANITNNLTLYVYYRISAEKSNFYLLAVRELRRTIALRYPGLAMHQQKRPSPDATNHETWMETYSGIEHVQLDKLIADLSELAPLHGLPCERKYEVFMNL